MKTVLFIHADSVEIYESGKLVIVGVFDTVNINKLPAILRPFGVAGKVVAEKRDYGKTYDAQVVFKKVGARKPLIELPVRLKFIKPKQPRLTACVFTLHFPPIKFETAGAYVFELRIGSKVLSDARVDVIKLKPTKKKT